MASRSGDPMQLRATPFFIRVLIAGVEEGARGVPARETALGEIPFQRIIHNESVKGARD